MRGVGRRAHHSGSGGGCHSRCHAERLGRQRRPPRTALADAWMSLRPATLQRTEVAAARVGRFVYVVGGFENAAERQLPRWSALRHSSRQLEAGPVDAGRTESSAATAYRGDV